MDRDSRVIVVDASVARAAGGREAANNLSINCRDLLDAMFEICHKVVVNDKMMQEWNKHASNYATGWMVRMANRGKREQVTESTNRSLRYRIRKQLGRGISYPAVKKDMPLIEVALLYDKIIISLDDKAKMKLVKVVKQIDELKDIMWVNPKLQGDKIVNWLQAGAPEETELKLCQYSVNL